MVIFEYNNILFLSIVGVCEAEVYMALKFIQWFKVFVCGDGIKAYFGLLPDGNFNFLDSD